MPFRKKAEDLQPEESEVLNRLFEKSPSLAQAYQKREELSAIFEEKSTKEEAIGKLNEWKAEVEKSGLRCFEPFLTMLDNWKDEITNYFVRRESSGFVEGMNNKIKVLKRRCYGIFHIGNLFQRLYLDREGYRVMRKAAP